MAQLLKKIGFEATIELLSGLHIGASTENAQIGGLDKPIIRRKKDDQPYIPGSSLKGKMRCLLEQRRGASEVGMSHEINNLFGYSATEIQSKILFRDADLTIESAKELKDNYNTDLPYSEVKFENSISRISGTATNPRQIERVPAGAKFSAKIVINVWDSDDEKKFIDLFMEGIKLLEADYIGGSGTRGYGHIKIELGEPKQLI
ncbi:MAG TPA: type III-A CRISPR-associated RAMP protein Csm3 [Saprospiraceae bacterium]|nr:type III-A CRISPR-associated RAMP protein Csm3 [Saprospiraceae bacterium]